MPKSGEKGRKFDAMTFKEAFSCIYNINYWNWRVSVSDRSIGPWRTEHVVKQLEKLVNDFKISMLLDFPSGNFLVHQGILFNTSKTNLN